MLFNSLAFLIFFPTVVFLYYALPNRWRIFLLLAASCIFYMAFVPKYIFILFFLITVDYFLAQIINQHADKKRKVFLIFSILANIGTLFVFKYFNFFNTNIATLASFFHWNYAPALLKIALPLGLSFHVFQSLSYVIEVYRGKYQPEKNYLTYALYVMFFPQLVAGPIERPQHLLPQFKLPHDFNRQNVRRGLERMLWGFFKKLVIADNIALIVNYVYANLEYFKNNESVVGLALILAAALFTYQLYCDFSGYSDIALGSALVLGYDLTENFNRPFAAHSIAEFWRRWHISLSNWLRDYLYYPLALGWGKVSKAKLYLSLFITFVLIGLWHGANWTFVVFGAIYGLYQIIGSLTEKARAKLAQLIGLTKLSKFHGFLKIVTTFCLVSLANVFFRADDLYQAWQIITHFGDGLVHVVDYKYLRYQLFTDKIFGVAKGVMAGVLLAIVIMEVIQYYQAKKNDLYIFENSNRLFRYGWYYFLLLSILFFGYLQASTFIYFQF